MKVIGDHHPMSAVQDFFYITSKIRKAKYGQEANSPSKVSQIFPRYEAPLHLAGPISPRRNLNLNKSQKVTNPIPILWWRNLSRFWSHHSNPKSLKNKTLRKQCSNDLLFYHLGDYYPIPQPWYIIPNFGRTQFQKPQNWGWFLALGLPPKISPLFTILDG